MRRAAAPRAGWALWSKGSAAPGRYFARRKYYDNFVRRDILRVTKYYDNCSRRDILKKRRAKMSKYLPGAAEPRLKRA